VPKVQTTEGVVCPHCGSKDVVDRRRRFYVSSAILLLAAGAMAVSAFADGWDWKHIVAVVGLVFVGLVDILAAVGTPWRCRQCRRAWR
jgi:membrane protein YdbS with pleckstrin-like domain